MPDIKISDDLAFEIIQLLVSWVGVKDCICSPYIDSDPNEKECDFCRKERVLERLSQ